MVKMQKVMFVPPHPFLSDGQRAPLSFISGRLHKMFYKVRSTNPKTSNRRSERTCGHQQLAEYDAILQRMP